MSAALFPRPHAEMPALSAALASHRGQPGERVKWTRRAATSRMDCEECAWLQHETRGAFRPRRQAKLRRTNAVGARLDLCRAHAHAWKTVDEADGVQR